MRTHTEAAASSSVGVIQRATKCRLTFPPHVLLEWVELAAKNKIIMLGTF